MLPSTAVTVHIDLLKIRSNIKQIAQKTGVGVIACVKADSYGFGAGYVISSISDLVEGFFVFDAAEAIDAKILERTGKRTIALNGQSNDPNDYLAQKIQPAVWSVERATALRKARPVIPVDTGQQRFTCPADLVAAVQKAGQCEEAFTHANQIEQVRLFDHITTAIGGFPFRHAIASNLHDEPTARFNAVRPGLAIYREALRVSARLVDVRQSTGPAGYSGFSAPRHGVIRIGYSNGLRAGPCLVNNRLSRIPEVGMQSAFVECLPSDKIGDEVVLLGNGLSIESVAAAWKCMRQECLLHLACCGIKQYTAP